MSRVTGVRQAILMWGARAACSGAVDYLRRCAPPVDTAPLRSLAPCLPDYVGIKPHSNNGGCPHALAPLPLRFAYIDLSRDTLPRSPCSQIYALRLPDPLAVTPPTIGAG